MRIIHSQA